TREDPARRDEGGAGTTRGAKRRNSRPGGAGKGTGTRGEGPARRTGQAKGAPGGTGGAEPGGHGTAGTGGAPDP
ncbi:hypothetical protein C3R44_22890, partial [Mycobacterium tuberculosis]